MGKKMYYSEQEACEKLNITPAQLNTYIRDQKLRVFQDGQKRMFRVEEVDSLAPQEEIELSPADTSSDIVSLTEADTPRGTSKEETVVTTDGISIFDDEELDVETADPLAKTQISQSIDEQYGLEGSGSGSGLLDLTRESDDTSLGAEVLEHIDMDGTVGPIGSSIAAAVGNAEPVSYGTRMDVGPAEHVAVYTPPDPSAGAFSGMIVGSAILVLVLGAVVLAAMMGTMPGYLEWLKNNMMIVLIGAAVLIAAGAGAGYALGKPSATPPAGQ